jgi:hypothetical protein
MNTVNSGINENLGDISSEFVDSVESSHD